jgi:hypothetical protein
MLSGGLTLLAPLSSDPYFRSLRAGKFTSKMLDTLSPTKLLELLVDASPEVSSALWNYQLFCNPGFTAKALKVNSKNDDDVDDKAQAALNEFIARLEELYGSMDVVISRLFMGPFMRGAFFAELVLDKTGRMPIDLVTPDAGTVRFRVIEDEDRGPIAQLGQMQSGQFVPLDGPTICYIPIHPLPGSPYGRALAHPAIFASLFLMAILHDLKRVVQQQGYPRYDITVDLEKILSHIPADIKDDSEKTDQFLKDAFAEVEKVYQSLDPDDAFMHDESVTMNRPISAMNSSSLGAMDGLFRALDRMVTRALKTMPFLMGSNEAVSETHANRQWEAFTSGIKVVQHPGETLLSRMFTLALQARGIAARVLVRFAELRASEELRDAQTQRIKNMNAAFEYDRGWIDNNQAARKTVGQDAVEQQPRKPVTDIPSVGAETPDPGSNRSNGPPAYRADVNS